MLDKVTVKCRFHVKIHFSSCLLCFTFVDFCHKQLIEILCEYYVSFVLETLRGLGFKLWWGARFSTPIQTSPEVHPVSSTLGTVSLCLV